MPPLPRVPPLNQDPRGKHLPQPSSDSSDSLMEGLALQQLGRFDEARALYEQVLAKDPQDFDALHLLGVIAAQTHNPSLAVDLIDRAIAINPRVAAAYSNRGAALKQLKRLDEAVSSYERAIALQPDTPEAHSNLGNALRELRRPEQALASYDRAIAIKPDYADAHYNRGQALKDLKRLDESAASYAHTLELNPGQEFLVGTLIHAFHQIGAWSDFDANNQFLAAQVESREKASPPFPVVTALDSSRLQRIAAQVWVETKCPPQGALGPIGLSLKKDKIRLGYYSADFYDHATCYLMAELFEAHDRNRFEVYAFSFGPEVKDGMRQRVGQAFDHFIDIRDQSDLEAARLSRELGIDIALDLKGYTQDSRPGIFSHRCAPVQVNYLGYPGTMGAPYMDYLIADKVLIPEESQIHYSEKIAYLPHSYQVNDTKRQIADTPFTRQALGLPEDGFVFCCFNNSFKITPHTFDGWMRILQAVPGSVLWLLDDNPQASGNLRKEASTRGVDSDRLVFGGRMPLPEHLARQRLADLFLDTLPCNAHTTASDALWAGLPVLTLMGQSFAGRVAASLLMALGLPELVADSQDNYEQKAIGWALDPGALCAIRQKLQGNRRATPLYDTPRFTRHIEQAFVQMHSRHLAGLPADYIEIRP
jgi:predicted O-linked N-acetylglucosamine transferase (SPINDLY family)